MIEEEIQYVIFDNEVDFRIYRAIITKLHELPKRGMNSLGSYVGPLECPPEGSFAQGWTRYKYGHKVHPSTGQIAHQVVDCDLEGNKNLLTVNEYNHVQDHRALATELTEDWFEEV